MHNKLLIDGALVDGATTLDVVNPATGKVFASCARADKGQLDQAVAAARKAFPKWSALSYAERGDYLSRIAQAISERQQEFVELITREQGKPIGESTFEVMAGAHRFVHYAGQTVPDKIIRDNEQGKVIEVNEPLGVIAAISPWNFPLITLASKIAAALITGNTVVGKPAPTTPLTALLLGEVTADILPPGVLNIVVDDNDLGPQLTSHPDIDMVSLTGSVATGRKVMETAGRTLKRLTLELGGNDAAIILDDADLDAVVPYVFMLATVNAGQVCLAAKRIFVPRAMYEDVSARIAAMAQGVKLGDGMKEGTTMGPIQNRRQYQRVLELIEDAAAQGKVLAGGKAVIGDGFFIEPTVIGDLPLDARLIREEQFGPVLPIIAYDDIDEVVDLANSTEFGLGGTIWTGNPDRGVTIARRIHSGNVYINQGPDGAPDVPMGGAKQSGIGREGGEDGLREFMQQKVIVVAPTS